MIIGFTGTQSGMTQWQKNELTKILKLKECSEFIHGDCIGADLEAANIALECGVRIFTVHPPFHDYKRAYWMNPNKRAMHLISGYQDIVWKLDPIGIKIKVKWEEPLPYHKRNQNIVDTVPLLIACPKEFKMSIRSGTWSTIRYAWKTKKNDLIIPPIERPEDKEDSSIE